MLPGLKSAHPEVALLIAGASLEGYSSARKACCLDHDAFHGLATEQLHYEGTGTFYPSHRR